MKVTSLLSALRAHGVHPRHRAVTSIFSAYGSGPLLLYKLSYALSNHEKCITSPIFVVQSEGVIRCYSSTSTPEPRDNQRGSSKAIVESTQSSGAVTVTMAEKVKENAKTTAYGGVILLGVIAMGAMGYVLLQEFFSSDSPQNIYSKSFKLCKLNPEVEDALGAPIKCYGEENSRGRRRHIAHQEFLIGNRKCIRMKYYIQGSFRKATVQLEKKMNQQGKYEYSYLIVDVEGYPARRIEINTQLLG